MSNAIDAWNATVTGMAQVSTLSVVMQSLFGATYMALGAWLLLSVYDLFCRKKIKLDDAGFLFFRWLGLMLFTFYYFS